MTKIISIKELCQGTEIADFWQKKRHYEQFDLFNKGSKEDSKNLLYFQSMEYYQIIMDLHRIANDGGSPLKFVYFYLEDQYIGFSMYKIYTQEDGKGFILDYCLDSTMRNQGLGTQVWKLFEEQLKQEGATYFNLNIGSEGARRFWMKQGFLPGETDEDGEILYCKELELKRTDN